MNGYSHVNLDSTRNHGDFSNGSAEIKMGDKFLSCVFIKEVAPFACRL